MTTLTGTEHSAMLRIHAELLDRLVAAAPQRRDPGAWDPDPATGEAAWIVRERHLLRDAVNQHRAARGLDPVSDEDIRPLESQAEGHSDYAHKFALYCANLAVGIDPLARPC